MREGSDHPRAVPARVGRYDILLPIASGGMATVYLARNQGAGGFESQVALKLTHAHLSADAEFAAIALEEAKLASRIRHRNVVSILDVGEDPLGLFLVMEYVEGDTLGGLVRHGMKANQAIPLPIAARILLDALAGLHAAHELRDEAGTLLGVVHRDFSPHNLVVGLDGVAKLTDFGIAKAADRLGHTATGVIKGKAGYMSPEQALGAPIDRRADVWSAGVVAWELHTMKRLFAGADVATLLRIVQEKAPRMTTVRPDIPAAIDDAVAGALERLPARTPTAAAFARTLADAYGSVTRVAEHDEVAAYVAAAVGPKLEDRKRQVQDMMRLRRAIDEVAEASIAANPGNTTGIEVGNRPAYARDDTATRTVSGNTPTITEPSPPTTATDTTSSAELRRLALPTRRRWREIVAVAAILAAAIAVPSWALRASKQAPAVAGALPVALPAVPSAVPSATPASGAADVAAPSTRPIVGPFDTVDVLANAPVSSLTLNGRVIALAAPSKEVTLKRNDAEKSSTVHVVAIAADGRRTTTELPPGSTALAIHFVGRPAASPAPTSTGHAPLTLAPSPFGQ